MIYMKNKNTCILCYEDVATGLNGFTYIDMAKLDAYMLDNPTFAVKHMFSMKTDILAHNDALRNNFYDLYAVYNLSPDSLDKTYLSPEGHIIIVRGIAPANRKYPIIIEDITINRKYKISQSYFNKYLAKTDCEIS